MSDNFVDTNIIIYSLGDDLEKRNRSIALISACPVLSVQVLNETANTLSRKFLLPIQDIQTITSRLAEECTVKALTEENHFSALTIKKRYQYSLYDSLIIASALAAGCSVLYSEDMQHQQIINEQLQILNPYLPV